MNNEIKGNRAPVASKESFHHRRRELALTLLAIIATTFVAAWFILTVVIGTSSSGWFSTYHNWIAMRGAKEWLIAWMCLGLAASVPQRKRFTPILIELCILWLVILDHWAVYINIVSINLEFVLLPMILIELTNLLWMYAGVRLGLLIANSCLAPKADSDKRSQVHSDHFTKKKVIRSIIIALIGTGIASLVGIAAWLVLSFGRWPNLASVLIFLQAVVITPLFRFICGMSVMGFAFILVAKNHRLKTGAAILGVAALTVVVYSTYFSVWGSHFFLIGKLNAGLFSANSLWTIPLMILLSPVGGFFVAMPMVYLMGFRFIKITTPKRSVSRDSENNDVLDGSLDVPDPEMYL